MAARASLSGYTGQRMVSPVMIGSGPPGVAAPFSLIGLRRFHGLGERNHPVRKGRKLMPTSSKPETSAIHRVLIDSGADPKRIQPAIEEMRNLSGQNVITAIGAQITELRSEMQAQIDGAASSDRRAPYGDAGSIHYAPGGDEHAEQVHLGAHQPAVHSHARPALQDPHVVTQIDFGRDTMRRRY